MAVALNAPHLNKGLDHLPSNVSHLCCNSDADDNNNSAEILEEACPLSGMISQMPALNGGRERGHRQPEAQSQDLSTAAQNENTSVQSDKSNRNNQMAQTVPKPQASGSAILAKDFVSGKWEALDGDDERGRTKRQLSDESNAHTITATKKTAVGGDKNKRGAENKGGAKNKGGVKQAKAVHSAGSQEKRANQGSPNKPGSRKNLYKELSFSRDDCHKIDTHTINAGKELKCKKIFSVQTIAQTITERASTDLERLRAIWIWLCNNIEYDVNGYLASTEKGFSPERVIETGRALCCGYSGVCLHMCKEVGIECREVTGHGRGVGYRQGQSYQDDKSNHSWNAVQLEGHWYLLDACWGAGTVDMDNRAFMKRYNEFYFLTAPEDFISSHCPDEEEWQLLDDPITLEDFEKLVLKTSEFYTLGLTLIHPKHSVLITENGEASISIGFSQPVDFTYQIFQRSGCEQKLLSSSVGLLTVTPTSMKLRLLPPTSGSFEVMLFARLGGTSGMFGWVCSFRVECPLPELQPVEDLPENPFLCWGMQQSSEALGLKPCACGSEAIVLKCGSFQLTLQTTRTLMMVCELTHKDLDETLAKRCLATQIEADKLTCNVLCPYTGYYRLSVFVRDYGNTGDNFQNAGNFLLHCTGNPTNLNELFPPALSNYCGPGITTCLVGLSKFSHTEAIVSTQQGELNITFQNLHDLDIHAVLSKEQRVRAGHALSRHVFLAHTGTKVTISATLPEPGVYKLSLYGSAAPEEDFAQLCDFVVRNAAEAGRPPFPNVYAAWTKGSELLEPRSGLLEPRSRVRLLVRVPGARRVCVLGGQPAELQLNDSDAWEGEAVTGDSGQLKIATCREQTSTDMVVLLSFDVQDAV